MSAGLGNPTTGESRFLVTASGILRVLGLVVLVAASIAWLSDGITYEQAVTAASLVVLGSAVVGYLRFELWRSPIWLALTLGGFCSAFAESLTDRGVLAMSINTIGHLLTCYSLVGFVRMGTRKNQESDQTASTWTEVITIVSALGAWFVAAVPAGGDISWSLTDGIYRFILAPINFALLITPVLLLLSRMRWSTGPTLLLAAMAIASVGNIEGSSLEATGPLDAQPTVSGLLILVGFAGCGVAILEPSVAQLGLGTTLWRRPRAWQRTAWVLVVPAFVIGGVAATATSWSDIAWPVLLVVSIALFAFRARLIADEMIARFNRRQADRGAEPPPLQVEELISWAQAIAPVSHTAGWSFETIAIVPVTDLDNRRHIGEWDLAADQVTGLDSVVDIDTLRRLRQAIRVSERLEPDWRGQWEICYQQDRFIVLVAGPSSHRADTKAENTDGLFTAAHLAESFSRWLALPFRTADLSVRIDFAIGYSSRERATPQDVQPLIEEAVSATANVAPGEPAAYNPTVRAAARRTAQLSALLDDALLDGVGLSVVYEPIVDLRTGITIGAETLARWNPDGWGSISPGEFIPIAERNKAILDLGEWVLRTACRAAAAVGDSEKLIGFNLSGPEVAHPLLYSRVMTIIEQVGISPSQVTVEVTETVLTDVMQGAQSSLRKLARQGVRLSMDDFGTEASGLARILMLPWDSVKLDRSLVVAAATAAGPDGDRDSPQASLIRAVVRLADVVEARVVAEGIEDIHTLRLLADLGAHLAQGWVFGKGRDSLGDAWADHTPDGFPFSVRIPHQRRVGPTLPHDWNSR